MRTIAFYSYKGGTGRTLALANIAAFAAVAGKHVVVLDMDLEAPGAGYKLLGDQRASAARCRGLVGYLLDSIADDREPDDLLQYLVEVKLEPDLGIVPQGGRLWLMPAGNIPSPNYFSELRRLNFDARAADGSAVTLMRGLLQRLASDLGPDLLMIDARTGITNSNALVLSELADEVYALFLDLLEQSEGTRTVLRSLSPLAQAGRPRLHAVLTRTPLEDEHYETGWLQTDRDVARLEATKAFFTAPTRPVGFSIDQIEMHQLHHGPSLVAAEELVLMNLARPGYTEQALAWDYARLARTIIDDEACFARVTAGLGQGSDDHRIGAVLVDDPGLRATFQIEPRAHPDSSDAMLPELIAAQRERASRDPAAQSELAELLRELALAERRVGRVTAAIAASDESVRRFSDLALRDQRFAPHFATALGTHGALLAQVGRYHDALTSTAQAVTHYRTLARGDSAYRPALASALLALASHLSELGRPEEALDAVEEAVALCRDLAGANPAAFNQTLATALSNQAARRSENGNLGGALGAIGEAVGLWRKLAAANPAAYLADLASSLHDLSNRQAEAGDRVAALSTITEAVEIRRQLAAANPAAYQADLASSLHNLSNQQAEAGDRVAALSTITEAVKIRRQLAAANPAVYQADLASSLNNLSNRQAEAGGRVAALSTITEAVEIRRQLAAANPAAYQADLASSLHNLSNQQAEAGDRVAALSTITEAVEIRRQLAAANPAVYQADLASSLNNLSNRQAEAGGRVAALSTITEAVEIRRQFAAANPAAYQADLASSLNNLAIHQSEAGDRTAALAAITEAVGHYRDLAQANPAAFLPDLASSLNNLAIHQSEAGDRTAALAAITEAVGHYRDLAQANPAAFLPDPASSLNNLAIHQSEAGDRTAALAAITEAVGHYRDLAQTNPAAFLPDLAMSLNNLSNRQAEAGDRTAALAAITEAVGHYRDLAQANPAAFLPDLASSLNNFSNRRAEAGDQTAALATITEAVEIRRQLAAANPAAYLPDLAGSLNNLTDLANVGETTGVWEAAIAEQGTRPARGELRIDSLSRLYRDGGAAAISPIELTTAISDIDAPVNARTDQIVAARARRAARALVQQAGVTAPNLPIWATAQLPDSHIDLINHLGASHDWPAIEEAIEALEDIAQAGLRASAEALDALDPDHPGPRLLLQLQTAIEEQGWEAFRDQQRQVHRARTLLDAWIAKRTWGESRIFYREHQDELAGDLAQQLLRDNRSEVARQHLAILQLAISLGPQRAFDLVTDPTLAENAANEALETGHSDLLALILTAAPELYVYRPLLALLGTALLDPAQQNQDGTLATDMRTAIADAAEAADPGQRRALATRLRGHQQHRPEDGTVDELIRALDLEDREPVRDSSSGEEGPY